MKFTNSIFKSILCISFLSLFSCGNNQEKKDDAITDVKLPNVILIVADDLGYADMSIAGLSNDIETPNIDRIAKSGVRFTQAYDNSPICNQSRTGIITGSYPQRLGSFWYASDGLHNDKFKTIPELLKPKGYHSGYIGKVHYGKHDSDITHRSFPLNHGFDYFFGHTSARKHYFNHKKEIEQTFLKAKKNHNKEGQSLEQGPLWENTNKVDSIAFLTELIGSKSREFIKETGNKPFFLQMAFNAAHNFTHQLPKEYLSKQDLSGYTDWDPAKEDYYDWYQKGRYPNNNEGRAHYLGQVHYMDQEIGKLLDFLEDNEILDETLIFFISDNGGSTPIYANNAPLKGSKYSLYEGGIRVQLLVSYPKKYAKAKVYNNMVSAMDILPSICKETGITIPNHIDGIDITPILTGEDTKIEHPILFWDTGHEMAARTGDWKLRKAFNAEHAKYEMIDLELGEYLYDLKKDIGETKNIIKNRPELLDSLEKAYTSWRANIERDINTKK